MNKEEREKIGTEEISREDLDYYHWLVRMISPFPGGRSSPVKIIRQLFNTAFTYTIPNDINRIYDGFGLRELYSNETGREADGRKVCSVLEVLIALSRRLAIDVIGDLDDTGLTGKLFFMMLDGLGIGELVGRRYDKELISVLLEIWMKRDFDRLGAGSPFPLKHADEDQRKVEIWKQALSFLAENSDILEEV